MDVILLPILRRATSPDEALKVMKQSRRSLAVVTESPPQGLITSSEVRKARNRHQANLQYAELQPLSVLFDGDFTSEGYGLRSLPDTTLAKLRAHWLQTFPGMAHRQFDVPVEDLLQFEEVLPPAAMHGFLGYERGAAVVLTRHEHLAEQASGPPPDCCCGNPDTPHEYPAGRKKAGQACDICVYVVEC